MEYRITLTEVERRLRMRINRIEPSEVRGRRDIATPNFYCRECSKITGDSFCTFYQREVDPNRNRCYNHSYYLPFSTSFTVPPSLDENVENQNK